MSSSFTNQPSPHDPRHNEEGYTPTPPPPARGEEAENDLVPEGPKLGSLAQKARGKQLKQARIIFFFVGGLTILVNLFDIGMFRTNFAKEVDKEIMKQGGPGMIQIDRALLQKEEDRGFLLCVAIDGVFIFTGVVFLILGAIVYRFPLPVTIVGLVLYIVAFGVGLLVVIAIGEPESIARYVGSGLIVRIFIIVGLIASIKSALAYEKDLQSEREHSLSGEAL